MTTTSYYAPHGGHPPQTQLLSGKAVFTEAYAVIPKGVMQDIVTSFLPHWEKTRNSASLRLAAPAVWRSSTRASAS